MKDKAKPKGKGKSKNELKEHVTNSFSSKLDTDEINPKTQAAKRGFGHAATAMIAPLKSLNR